MLKIKFGYTDPGMIMTVIAMFIVLTVGVFAFYTVINSIGSMNANNTSKPPEGAIKDIDETASSIFSILPIVFIIAVVATILGVISHFAGGLGGGSYSSSSISSIAEDEEEVIQKANSYKPPRATPLKDSPPTEIGDYQLSGMESIDDAIQKSKEYRDTGFWTKIVNYQGNKKVNFQKDKPCGVYISKWSKNDQEISGKPKWDKV